MYMYIPYTAKFSRLRIFEDVQLHAFHRNNFVDQENVVSYYAILKENDSWHLILVVPDRSAKT